MNTTHSIYNALLGCFVGLAIGDALGMPLEFAKRDSKPPITGMRAGGPFNLKAGTYTDDTIMAVHMAESLITNGRIDADDLVSRWRSWMLHGIGSPTGHCFDIGTQTRAVLAAPADKRVRIALDGKGNGTLMRMAPAFVHAVATHQHNDMLSHVAGLAAEQSRVTHGVLAAQCCTGLAVAMLAGLRGEKLPWLASVPGLRDVSCLNRDDISSSGYCLHTLEAALWAVWHTSSFADALLLAVNLADDSDSVGAVTGQLAGALYGIEAIPLDWLQALHRVDYIQLLAETLISDDCIDPPNDEA